MVARCGQRSCSGALGEATRTTQSPKQRLSRRHHQRTRGAAQNTINARQDVSFSYERERPPRWVPAASHTRRGLLATGRTAALVGRGSDSLSFPRSTPQSKRALVREMRTIQKKGTVCFLTDPERLVKRCGGCLCTCRSWWRWQERLDGVGVWTMVCGARHREARLRLGTGVGVSVLDVAVGICVCRWVRLGDHDPGEGREGRVDKEGRIGAAGACIAHVKEIKMVGVEGEGR
jgi:hypothetical protein